METWSLEPEYHDSKIIGDNFLMHLTLNSATVSISNNFGLLLSHLSCFSVDISSTNQANVFKDPYSHTIFTDYNLIISGCSKYKDFLVISESLGCKNGMKWQMLYFSEIT